MKWKYANPKKKNYDQYLRILRDEPKTIIISGWNFDRNQYTDAVFFADISEENGEEVSKVWSVWNKKLRDILKTLLKKKNSFTDKVKLKIVLRVEKAVDVFKVRELKL